MTDSICTRCGLCCDGTLFVRVPIEDSEVEWARSQVLTVVEHDHRNGFAQPCQCFGADGKCNVYKSRPATCQRFRCKLLRKVESSAACDGEPPDPEVTDSALATIAQAKELRDLVNSRLPGPKSLAERLNGFLRSLGDTTTPPDAATLAFRQENRDLTNAVVILSVLLNREFRDPDRKPDIKTPPDAVSEDAPPG